MVGEEEEENEGDEEKERKGEKKRVRESGNEGLPSDPSIFSNVLNSIDLPFRLFMCCPVSLDLMGSL